MSSNPSGMEIMVLGPGCTNCVRLRDMVADALSAIGIEPVVTHVTDIREIMKYVNSTPGLVINGRVKHSGRPLPSPENIKSLIMEEML